MLLSCLCCMPGALPRQSHLIGSQYLRMTSMAAGQSIQGCRASEDVTDRVVLGHVQYDISDYRERLYAEILRRRKELKHADRAARDRAKGRSRSHKSSSQAVHDSHAVNGAYYK